MSYSNDHVRRELREVQRAHEATRRPFEAALDEAFDPESGTPTEAKGQLVGVPSRRQLLKLGGLTIASTTLLAACVEPHSADQVAINGTIIPTPTTTEPLDPGSPELDATLVLTAISVEQLAIDTYQAALDNNWLQSPLLRDVAEYFKGQHEDHRGALEAQATRLGQNGNEVQANEYLNTNVVQPGVTEIQAGGGTVQEMSTITLATELEVSAAETYAKAGGILTTPSLRQAIMAIGGIEARHIAVLAGVLGDQQAAFALLPTVNAAPPDAYIEPNGPVTAASDEETSGTVPEG